ncbi:MAG TPA: ATP-binding protein [Edaphobacter sp.]|nr:ATP-binding protein [Edaphobacter sp.]
MRSTVRFRLTLWYVAALATILIVFSVGVYSLLGKSLKQNLDGSLHSATQVTALALNHEIEEHGGKEAGEANVRFVLNTMYQTSFPRPSIVVWDGERLVAQKPGSAGLPPINVQRLYPQLNDGSIRFLNLQKGIQLYRVAITRVSVPNINASYRVVANESVQPVNAELATLRGVLFIIVPVCLLLAAAGGYFLARKSLAPVLDMARTAEQISSHNLDQRLSSGNKNEELGQLADTFNRLFGRLQQAFRQQRQFMTDASHELRTPLSVALTATEVSLTARRQDLAELQETLKVVQSQLFRLRRIVEDMFMLAQADTGTYQPTITRFYLDEVLVESVRAARILAVVRNITVTIDHLTPEALLVADEDLLRQLFLILLDNAVKYTPEGGAIQVSLVSHKEEYKISIADNGPGIAVSDQPYVFDRFYRADRSRSRREPGTGSGAGLGLAIAQWIAHLHHGDVRLENSNSRGTVFGVWLPQR